MKFSDFYIRESDDLVQRALILATKAHEGQTRRFDGAPYINHPKQVADIVMKATNDNEMIAAALCHDTLEDTSVTYEDLKEKFGLRVADLVQELTSDESEIERIGKTAYLIQKMNNMSDDALVIKLADRISNVSDFKTASQKFRDKYGPSTREIIDSVKPRSSVHSELIGKIDNIISSFGY